MKDWKPINPEELADNVFKLIGKDWMLITAGTEDDYNTMTASWGGMGVLWHKPVATVYIRPVRYTDEFVKKNELFTLSFFEEKYRDVLTICGTISGRNEDKAAIVGLHAEPLPEGGLSFREARLAISCRKLYQDTLKPEHFLDSAIEKNYPKKDYHNIYIGEITSCWRFDGR
ncbi:MAG: flavin reductase family protein [Acidobacteria bacterium]|nr:flavin reductase family protein [Acidobacteriota bacterium]